LKAGLDRLRVEKCKALKDAHQLCNRHIDSAGPYQALGEKTALGEYCHKGLHLLTRVCENVHPSQDLSAARDGLRALIEPEGQKVRPEELGRVEAHNIHGGCLEAALEKDLS
jgi:hypothetical protein